MLLAILALYVICVRTFGFGFSVESSFLSSSRSAQLKWIDLEVTELLLMEVEVSREVNGLRPRDMSRKDMLA